MEKEKVMSEDLAMKEIERWAEDKDIDIYVMDNSGKRVLDSSIPRLLKEIQRGNLFLNDDCDFVYWRHDFSGTWIDWRICGTYVYLYESFSSICSS